MQAVETHLAVIQSVQQTDRLDLGGKEGSCYLQELAQNSTEFTYWLSILEEKISHPIAEMEQQCPAKEGVWAERGVNWPVLPCPILQALN